MSAKRDSRLLQKADKEMWCILPPEDGHPFPISASRLMFKANPKAKTIRDRWVTIVLGGEMTLKYIKGKQQDVTLTVVPALTTLVAIPILKEN